jgi:hypothetical protein
MAKKPPGAGIPPGVVVFFVTLVVLLFIAAFWIAGLRVGAETIPSTPSAGA